MADSGELGETISSVLRRLSDLEVGRHGSQESQGATYRQLGFIAHRAGMDAERRSQWYRVAEEIPLSGRHASHIAARLTDDEEEEVQRLDEMWEGE